MNKVKAIVFQLPILIAICLSLFSCDADGDRITYGDKEYIMFTATENEYFVSPNDSFTVDIASTVACGYDRNVIVEVVNSGSTAVEGVHFNLETPNVTIKAGEYSAKVTIKGNFKNVLKGDSIGTSFDTLRTTLRLRIPKEVQWDLYPENLETTINFHAFVPFNLDDWFYNEKREDNPEKYNYANYIFYASFPYSTGDRFEQKLVKVYQDTKDPERMIVTDPFGSGRDIKLRLHPGGPGENKVSMIPQESFYASNYGWITMASMDGGCFYNSHEHFITMNLNCYVDQLGTLGVYPYIMVWVSEHKAVELRNSGRY